MPEFVNPLGSELKPDYDVVIAGGGMVGSMLAAALGTHGGLRVAVLENHMPEPFEPGSDPDYDIRVSALSIATQRMFENVGAWQGVLNRRACPYREMLVWDGEESGRTHFKASDIAAPELGHIVENRVIQLALLDQLKRSPNIDYHCPVKLGNFHLAGNRVICRLSREPQAGLRKPGAGAEPPETISTRLLVGADGARSTVRKLAGIDSTSSRYPQHALVATIKTTRPQQDITWQRFKPTGPEAFLPLCGSHASMVWYHTEEEVKRLVAMSDADFMFAMESTFPDELGGIEQVIARGSFPIAKAHARQYVAERVALIGDAAHTVHPLAGQGVNLGMLDAAALADVLTQASERGSDIGSRRVLRRYERWRRSDNAVMISVLDGFYHAFKPQPAPVRKLRSAALDMANRAGPLKHFVMRYAMGIEGELPTLAK